MRAGLLRGLDGERSMTWIASALGMTASATTHHVDALLAAGSVVRRREGRHHMTGRTARGDGVLDLYGMAD